MIITKNYAKKLIRSGRAAIEGTISQEYRNFACLTRYDLQRTDHFAVTDTEASKINENKA